MTTDTSNRHSVRRCCPVMLGLLLLAGVANAGERVSARPNVLLFFTDDQRASTIGATGNPQIDTPNLDELATRGTAFTRAYMMGGMTGATCVPSRAMLHSGRHLFHLRNRGHVFSPDDTTLGETFRAAGYVTYFTGKRHSLTRDRIKSQEQSLSSGIGAMAKLPSHHRVPVVHPGGASNTFSQATRRSRWCGL